MLFQHHLIAYFLLKSVMDQMNSDSVDLLKQGWISSVICQLLYHQPIRANLMRIFI